MGTKYPPAPNIGSQIERALIAYLQGVFGEEAAGYNWYFSNDWKVRQAPFIAVLAHKSTETVKHTRNESYMVKIEAEWKGTNVAGQPAGDNPDTDWLTINRMIGLVMAGMSVSGGGGPNDVPETTAQDITAAAWAAAGAAPDVDGDLAGTADGDGHWLTGFAVEYVEYHGAQRAQVDPGGTLYITEVRNFEIRAGNL